MAEHNDLGKKGEEMVEAFLKEKGYAILERNWYHQKAEVDIIAMEKEELVFVEVKTRGLGCIEDPENAVNKRKQRLIVKAADAYIQEKDLENEARFDIVTVTFEHDNHTINHLPDAFYALL